MLLAGSVFQLKDNWIRIQLNNDLLDKTFKTLSWVDEPGSAGTNLPFWSLPDIWK
jgi:hypothetical protein